MCRNFDGSIDPDHFIDFSVKFVYNILTYLYHQDARCNGCSTFSNIHVFFGWITGNEKRDVVLSMRQQYKNKEL